MPLQHYLHLGKHWCEAHHTQINSSSNDVSFKRHSKEVIIRLPEYFKSLSVSINNIMKYLSTIFLVSQLCLNHRTTKKPSKTTTLL